MLDIDKEILYGHYAHTLDSLKQLNDKRDKFFLLLLLSICTFTVQLADGNFLDAIIMKVSGANHSSLPNQSLLSTFFWVVSLFIFIKYFQLCYFINRKLSYLAKIELTLNSIYTDDDVFTLEGKFYKKKSNFSRKIVGFAYKKVAPIVIGIFISVRIISEYNQATQNDVYLIVNISVYIIYIFFLLTFAFKNE